MGRLREVPNTLSELAQDIARKLGKPLFDPDSLDYQTWEVTRMAKALDRLNGEIGEKIELRNEVGDDLQRESARLESLRQGTRAAERDVEELRPIAAEVRRYEGAGRAERGTILDSIAARCAGAARAARAAIEELGDRIWALMRPRKAKTEQRSLDDVMREATDVARASEALSRGHVAPTNSRPRGQAR